MSSFDTLLIGSAAFRAGEDSMQRRIGELLRQRKSLIASLPMGHLNRTNIVLCAEIDVIIRAVDSLPHIGQG